MNRDVSPQNEFNTVHFTFIKIQLIQPFLLLRRSTEM